MKIKSARALHARLAPRPHYYQSITPAMPARNFAYGSDGSDRNNISDTDTSYPKNIGFCNCQGMYVKGSKYRL